MKNKNYLIAALLIGGALAFPHAVPAAEKDMMKDDKAGMEKGMMKDDKGMMKDQKGMMKEGKDAMMKGKMKAEKSGKMGMSEDKMKTDDKMKMDDTMKMEQKK
jgi:hypothetical protein